MLRQRLFLLAGLLPALSMHCAIAAEDWGLCRIPSYSFSINQSIALGDTEVQAQSVSRQSETRLDLAGDVELRRRGVSIYADEVSLFRDIELVQARGNVVFENPDFRLKSDAADLDNANQTAWFEQSEYQLSLGHAHGEASRITLFDPERSVLNQVSYTSCDPDDIDWRLTATNLHIDQQSGRGTSRHTVLYFKKVPFLYSPWFQFPIDDRRMSGLLTPGIGYSEKDGFNLILPIYWNIAPNYDMTITPAYYDRRGLQMNTENRYLFRNSRGQIDLSYLDDDEFGDTREFQRWQHDARLGGVNASLLFVEVSDKDFFNDFRTVGQQYRDVDHLERRLRLTRSWDYWNAVLRYQDYQTPNEFTSIGSRPYNRQPQLAVNSTAVPLFGGSEGRLETEWVDFFREESVTGQRAHVVGSLGWTSRNSWYFLEPELQYALTDYRLEDNPGGDSISRDVPTASLDSGLVFERLAGSRGQWIQTLEPRLFFLYTPYVDQDDIPNFDTSLASSTYNNLFRSNRFVGADRIGDAKQVTFGLASQIFDSDSGNRLMNARAGQIFYFEDRRVSLNRIEDDTPTSELITEIDIWPAHHTRISGRLVYDEKLEEELRKKDFSVSYSNNGYALNAAYYFEEASLEQALFSFVYPVNERWTVIGKMQQSLLFDETVENLAGVNYESCCYGFKILYSETGDRDEDYAETDRRIFFELTFKGLSKAGQDIDARLYRAIPGYRPGF